MEGGVEEEAADRGVEPGAGIREQVRWDQADRADAERGGAGQAECADHPRAWTAAIRKDHHHQGSERDRVKADREYDSERAGVSVRRQAEPVADLVQRERGVPELEADLAAGGRANQRGPSRGDGEESDRGQPGACIRVWKQASQGDDCGGGGRDHVQRVHAPPPLVARQPEQGSEGNRGDGDGEGERHAD